MARRGAFQFKIESLVGLDKALKELPKSVRKSTLRRILKGAAKPVVRDAKAAAPVGPTGNLRESIRAHTKLKPSQDRKRAKAGDVELFIGATWPLGAHAHLVEFGTYKTPPHPFLRPAWDANRDRLLKHIGDEAWKEIAKAAKRLARRAEKGTLGKSTVRQLRG